MYSLSGKASTDLDSIFDYSIVNFGVVVMIEYHQSLEKCFDILNSNPDLGTKADHIRPHYMSFQHRAHLVFYKKTHQGILIMRILHKSMDTPRHFN